jgi:hypothetical protein
MSIGALLDSGPNLQNITNAFSEAAKALDGGTPIQDVAKKLITDVAKALAPNSNPNVTIDKLVNNGIDDKSMLALGAYAAIFKMGLNMSFGGVPGVNDGKGFAVELMKVLAPEGMNQLKDAVYKMGDAFRAWKN